MCFIILFFFFDVALLLWCFMFLRYRLESVPHSDRSAQPELVALERGRPAQGFTFQQRWDNVVTTQRYKATLQRCYNVTTLQRYMSQDVISLLYHCILQSWPKPPSHVPALSLWLHLWKPATGTAETNETSTSESQAIESDRVPSIKVKEITQNTSDIVWLWRFHRKK